MEPFGFLADLVYSGRTMSGGEMLMRTFHCTSHQQEKTPLPHYEETVGTATEEQVS
jgi:hypothetical protein